MAAGKLRGLRVLNQRTQEPRWLQVNYSVTAHWIDAYIKLITAFFHDFSHLINTFCEELSTESSIIYFFVCEQQPGSSNCARVMTVHVLTDALWTAVDLGGCFWRCCRSVTWVCYRKATRVWLLLFWHLDITNFFRLYSHRLHLRLVSEESRLYTAEESSVTIIGKEGTKKGRRIGHVGFYL